MRIRTATPLDVAALEELWRAFEREVPPPPHVDHDPARELDEIREIVESGLAFLADDDDGTASGSRSHAGPAPGSAG